MNSEQAEQIAQQLYLRLVVQAATVHHVFTEGSMDEPSADDCLRKARRFAGQLDEPEQARMPKVLDDAHVVLHLCDVERDMFWASPAGQWLVSVGQPEYLTMTHQEAADALGVRRESIPRMLREGRLERETDGITMESVARVKRTLRK